VYSLNDRSAGRTPQPSAALRIAHELPRVAQQLLVSAEGQNLVVQLEQVHPPYFSATPAEDLVKRQ